MADKLFQEHNGVTISAGYVEDGDFINVETLPGPAVQSILDSVQRANSQPLNKASEFRPAARIPNTLQAQWRREWAAGPKLWGVPWGKFKMKKILSPEYAKLRIMTP